MPRPVQVGTRSCILALTPSAILLPSPTRPTLLSVSVRGIACRMPTSFEEILDKAVADYREQVGIELDRHPFIDELRGRDSPNDVLKLLKEKANAFKVYRDGNRKLINWLSPVVQVIHVLSGVLGEAA